MECNKDEALRAKQIAESKMQRGDYVAALKFAMKAQKLFPDLQNIVQILTVCEVHCAAQRKISGSEMDWYGILQTDRLADEVTIKKQYRKLALLLHPDKNKCDGAEAAFKLIGEANRILSDQTKRSQYNMIPGVSVGTAAPKPPPHPSNASSFGMARNYQNGFSFPSNSQNIHQPVEHQTFWTSCPHCKTRLQYLKTLLNATLRCEQCFKSYRALELGYQGVPPGYTWTSCNNHKEAPKQMPPKAASERSGEKPCGTGQEGMFGQSDPASMTKCTAGVGGHCKVGKSKDHVAAEGMKAFAGMSKAAATSKAKASQTSNIGSRRARQSASDLGDDNKSRNGDDLKEANVRENGFDASGLSKGAHHRRSSRKRQHGSFKETTQDDGVESSSKRQRQHETFSTTEVERAEVPASGGLFRNHRPASFTDAVGGQNGEVRSKASGPSEEALLRNKTKIEQVHAQRTEGSKSDVDDRKLDTNRSQLNSNSPPIAEIICPDPDFGDFEKDKAENCFAAGQFWAIYDNSDSMPRFYAIVKKVFSPFKLQITWLEPDPDNQSEIDWHDADLPVACGKFELGKSQKTTDRQMFSHQIHCIKGSGRGSYLVYPYKGEIWAIFRDWDIGWSSNPEKYKEHQFEYVEVLSDFDDNVGIKVAYLCKVKGFVSLFQQTVQNGVSLFCVPPNELYRFSHRIPSYKMTGDEREGVPRGSFELDPAGLPSNLFEVGDPGDVNIENGVLNNGVNCSRHDSSKCKVEKVMSDVSSPKTKLHESNNADGVSSIHRRSPRSYRKSMDNGQDSITQSMAREDDKGVGHGDNGQPEGAAAAFQANEKVKTPQKNEKNIYERVALNVRRSPRDLSRKVGVDSGEFTKSRVTDDDSNAKNENSSHSQSVGNGRTCLKKDYRILGGSTYDFKKEISEDRFQCDQIWAIYGDRDHMPEIYAQIKKIEHIPNFRLLTSILEPCSAPNGLNRTVACGTFKVKRAKPEILSLSAFSHKVRFEPVSNNTYAIYPRKGEIWALYKDQNCEFTFSDQGKRECHIVEVLSDSDKIIQVAILTPHRGSQHLFQAPRIQRSRTGIVEISRDEVHRFSHQIPAFQHSGEGDVHLRGCWVLDPSSVPGCLIQID